MPPTSGIIRPPVRPKEWNTGSTLNTRSSPLASTRARHCATLASMLRCDSTTPLGIALRARGEQDDGRIVRLARNALARAGEQAGDLVRQRRCGRGCPPGRRCARSRRSRRPGRPAAPSPRTRARSGSTETLAAAQAARMLAAPLEKLIMAGTRPIDCRAKNVTATPPSSAASRRPRRRPGRMPRACGPAPARRGSAWRS